MSFKASGYRKRTAEKAGVVPEKKKYWSIMEREISIDFTDCNVVHDRVLAVQDSKFYVVSGILSLFSNYFNRMFTCEYKEKEQKEIELKDIEANDFHNFLLALSFTNVDTDEENVFGLVKLADRFESPVVWQKCWNFILNENNFHFAFRVIDWMSHNGMCILDELEDRIAASMKRHKFDEVYSELFKDALELVLALQLFKIKTVLEEWLVDYLETPRPDPDYYDKYEQLLPPPCNILEWSFKYELEAVKEYYTKFFEKVESDDDVFSFFDQHKNQIRNLSAGIQQFIHDLITPLFKPKYSRVHKLYIEALDKIRP